MRERYLPAAIMLIAGAITSILNIVNKVELLTGLKRLLFVLIVFYLIGIIAKAVIVKALKKVSNTPDDSDNLEEENQSEDK